MGRKCWLISWGKNHTDHWILLEAIAMFINTSEMSDLGMKNQGIYFEKFY